MQRRRLRSRYQLDGYHFITTNLSIAGRGMLEYFGVCSFDKLAFGTAEYQLFEDFFHNSMHFCDLVCAHALLALPFALSRNKSCVAFMTVDAVALGALFGLEHHELADATEEVIHCIG